MICLIFTLFAIDSYLPIFSWSLGVENIFLDWTGYFLLGYLMTQDDIRRYYRRLAETYFVLFFLVFLWRAELPDFQGEYSSNLAPHVMLLCVGLFALFTELSPVFERLRPVSWLIVKISKYCFSIYMIHIPILGVYLNIFHPGIADTARGAVKASLVIFLWSLLFALVYDNLVTFNVQRLLRLVSRKIRRKAAGA